MATMDKKISQLDTKASPVGADTIALVDSVGGDNAKATLTTLPISTPVQTALNLKQDAAGLVPAAQAIAASDIDWSILLIKGGVYTKDLTATTTFTFSNVAVGSIIVRVKNGGAWLVNWPATVKWSADAAPTQTVGVNRTDIYTFIYDGTTVFGSVVQDFRL